MRAGGGDGSRLAQVGRRREEQLEQVREEADSEGLAHGARSEVGEAREERERTQPIRRREEDLKEDGQLLGWRVLSGGPATQPHFESNELLGEEVGLRERQNLCGGRAGAAVGGGVVALREELRDDGVERGVPRLIAS